MNRSTLLVVMAFSVFGTILPASAKDPNVAGATAEKDKSATFASRTLTLADIVLDRHVDPPTRQQMILDGTKALYRTSGKRVPRGLSREVSALSSDGDFTDFLNKVGSKFGGNADRRQAAFIAGMLRTLVGRHRLIGAESLKVQGQLIANRYVGTGIVLRKDGKAKRPAIPRAFYNGPAWKAGVKPGDLILAIDGKDTAKMSLGTVVQMLRGKAGSIVEMNVRRPDSKTVRTLKITRGVAFIPTVEGHRQISEGKWQFRVDSARDLAYLRINRTGSSTLHELRQVERQLRGKGIRGVVLDLRYGGGTLHDIVMIADALLDGGVIGRVRTGDAVKTHKSNPGALFANLPMAVLVDSTASGGREFLAAALQDNRRATVIGEPTPGDGVVRTAIAIPGWDHAVIIAVGELQRGDGTPLRALTRSGEHRVAGPAVRIGKPKPNRPGGLTPNHVVRLTTARRMELMRTYAYTTPGLKKPVADPVLSKAVNVLNAKVKQAGANEKKKKVSG